MGLRVGYLSHDGSQDFEISNTFPAVSRNMREMFLARGRFPNQAIHPVENCRLVTVFSSD
jgi:hypothetical protein